MQLQDEITLDYNERLPQALPQPYIVKAMWFDGTQTSGRSIEKEFGRYGVDWNEMPNMVTGHSTVTLNKNGQRIKMALNDWIVLYSTGEVFIVDNETYKRGYMP